ncbi:MAG: ketol-acid reductoisomerase [Candidatus Krumholzibacteria bacterium]|nr:ketol-acid reductoisomerase [Candidatus Krumholzibacteria bacterium]
MKVLDETAVPAGSLDGSTVVVLGYGNQGRPQALNLRDSGCEVLVAARAGGEGAERAARDGFSVLDPRAGAEAADVLMMLVPDEVQGAVFAETVRGRLRPGSALCFAHGFAVAFGGVSSPEHDIVMVAPKGQGRRVREAYLEGTGLPCLIAVERDATGGARRTALGIARALGCLRVGAIETSFREEAVSDLFGEQAVLVGGVPALVKSAFRLLVEKGCTPEVAYFECVHELKIIVDLVAERGFSGMRRMISGTAAYGGLKYGERLVTEETVREMRRLYDRIESGAFAGDWLDEARRGCGSLEELIVLERDADIERTGTRVRKLFPGGDGEAEPGGRQ